MESLNVFIGSTAVRWSEKIKGHNLLLDTNQEKNKNVLSPSSFPSNETKEIKAYNFKFELLKNNYNNFIDIVESDLECVDFLSEVQTEIKKYNHINIIVASGGLFGNTFTPIVLSYIENHQSANIYIQKSKVEFLWEKENLLLDYVNENFNITPIIIEIENFVEKFKKDTLDKALSELDKVALAKINTESERRDFNLKFKDIIYPTQTFKGKVINAEKRITKRGKSFVILEVQFKHHSETYYLFDKEQTETTPFYKVDEPITIKGNMSKKWILTEKLQFKITSIER